MHALYIIGEPGVGKSTLAAELTAGLPYEEGDQPFAFLRYDCGVTEFGRRREAFSGTDALALDVQPKVLAYLEGIRPRYIFAEGDRLANDKFFDGLVALGYELDVVYLFGADLAAERRDRRGSAQNETWLKGRQTKVTRLANVWATQWLAADAPVSQLAAAVEGEVAEVLIAHRAVLA